MRLQPLLFLDRDGCLIEEPPDEQVDSLDKFRLMPGVIPALAALRQAGYRLIMVSNQDGLGTPAFPREAFEPPQQLLLHILQSQGAALDAVHVDPHVESAQAPTRKPGIAMLTGYLADMDPARSAVIGDRESDMQLARNLGIRGLRIGNGAHDWPTVARLLLSTPRRAEVRRETRETAITAALDLDTDTPVNIHTGIGFFDHMLEQLAAHGGFSLDLRCDGDLHVDEHHTVEDCALALGEALDRALSTRHGIGRYGFVLPMDEAIAEAAVDLSGRPCYVQHGSFPRDQVGGLHTEMVSHFFHSLAQALGAAIHLTVRGENTHHMIEAVFKGVGRALRPALARSGGGLPSTKGLL